MRNHDIAALAIVEGRQLPWDEETDCDSESDSSEDDSVYNLQGNTELRQLFASAHAATTSLMRLSMAIREPAPSRQVMSIDKSSYVPWDVQHAQTKFPESAVYLTERLGRATSSRRQYLTYREQHCKKLAKGIEKLGLEEPRTEYTANSTEATPVPESDPASSITPEQQSLDDGYETLSQTSYAPSVRDSIRTPRIPREASKRQPYECPICFSLIAIYSSAAWK
jgi:hypothetical protein